MKLLLHVEDGRGGYLHVDDLTDDVALVFSTEESAGGVCTLAAPDVVRLVQVLGDWLLATGSVNTTWRRVDEAPPSRGEDD